MAADSSISPRPLQQFLRNGRLPFLGREEETEHLASFIAEATNSHELRIALVLAEAGMGKSRLIEETLPSFVDSSTVLLHVKLYPEGATAIPPLLVDALAEHPNCTALLRQTPERSVSSVAEALRRIARLRPTLLVLEDLHLLAEESLREFSRLLEAIADEPVSMICLARPQEFRARGVVERWTVETVELQPLSRERIGEMWEQMFGTAPSAEIVETVHTATRGNLLALRSALRGLMGAEALVDDGADRWRVGVSPSDFRKVVRHAVELVVEGMVAHIDLGLMQRAEQLATLGELFSAYSAQLLLNNADETIDLLLNAGVLTSLTVTPRSILSATSEEREDRAYAFTHSLLHQYLVDRRQIDPDRLLSILAARAPLYSFLPITLIHEHVAELSVDEEAMRTAFSLLLELANQVDGSSDWKLSPGILYLAGDLLSHYPAAWSGEELESSHISLLRARAGVNRRQFNDDYRALLEELLERTASPQSSANAKHRLSAIAYAIGHYSQFEPEKLEEFSNELEALAEAFPTLQNVALYANGLHSIAYAAFHRQEMPLFDRACAALQRMMDDPRLDDPKRSIALFHLANAIMWKMENAAQVEERRALIARARAELPNLDRAIYEPTLRMRELVFLAQTGSYREFLGLCDGAIELFRSRGLWQNFFFASLNRQMALAAMGADLDTVARSILALLASLPPSMPASIRTSGVEWPIQIGALRNAPGWAREMSRGILKPEDHPSSYALLVLDLIEGDLDSIRARLADTIVLRLDDNLCDLIAPLFGQGTPPEDRAEWASGLRTRITEEHVRTTRYMDLIVILHALRLTATEHPDLYDSLLPDMRSAILRWMEWMEERGMASFMRGVLEQFESMLTQKDVAGLRGRIAALEETLSASAGRSSRVRVSMLGSIRVALPGEELEPLKGVRIRTMLGLMIADRMLREPLESREFLSIAAGEEEEYELARKKRNMGVVRLREALGADAVLTDGETPQLNLALVEVDLLEAHKRIESAREALRDRSLARATAAVLELLEITGGEVAFPTLYEEFFEAARDEFEVRLRSTALATVDALEREEDTERAEEILQKMAAIIPDDEEIIDRLAELLEASGRKMEAARVRLRSATLERSESRSGRRSV